MMKDQKQPLNDFIEVEYISNDCTIYLPENYTSVTAAQILKLEDIILQKGIGKVVVDASRLLYITSFGAEYLILEQKVKSKKEIDFQLINVPDDFALILSLMDI